MLPLAITRYAVSAFYLSFNSEELTLNSEEDYLTLASLDGRKTL